VTAKHQIDPVGIRRTQVLCSGIGMATSTASTARCGPACWVVGQQTGQLYWPLYVGFGVVNGELAVNLRYYILIK